jgi:hypothetical protein
MVFAESASVKSVNFDVRDGMATNANGLDDRFFLMFDTYRGVDEDSPKGIESWARSCGWT